MSSSELRFTIWGKHPVLEALRSKRVRVHHVYCTKEAAPLLSGQRVKVVPADSITSRAGTAKHQGLCAEIELDVHSSVKEFRPLSGTSLFGLALDSMQDPQNVGALIRSADFFGFSFVMLTKDRSSPLSGAVAKASAGGLFSTPVIMVSNLARELLVAQEEGFWCVGLDARAEKSLAKDAVPAGPVLLVVGSEGEGLRDLTKRNCHDMLRIGRPDRRESLNASVAGGIAMFELTR